mmetsp:Transcript_18455/g.27491  ORF Transcript_18455/g.27491 Transcript_18455/m.27491 type:complete len:251 (-) Transcript_18455:670-1422(-)
MFNQLRKKITGSRNSCNTSKHHTIKKRRATQAIGTVDTTTCFTSGPQSRNWFLSCSRDDARIWCNFKTTHRIVNRWRHDSHMKVIIHRIWSIAKVLSAKWILFCLGSGIVRCKSVGQLLVRTTNFGSELLARKNVLHETFSCIVVTMPFDFLGSSRVEYEPKWTLIFLHHSTHIISVTKFITKTSTIGVKQEATNTAQCLGSEKAQFGIGFFGIDQTRWMHLHLFHIDKIGANCLCHFETVSRRMITIGG